MSVPKPLQFDLFTPFLTDAAFRHQRDLMERPFFSLYKRKRNTPINYTSPDGKIVVNIDPHPKWGMPTIWDADILIYIASAIQEMRNQRINDIPREIHIMPHTLLTSIGRTTGGANYQRLRAGLERLQSATIQTNIRASGKKKYAQFNLIQSFTDIVDEKTAMSRGITIHLSEWFYQGIMQDGGVLKINPDYFNITRGWERWLYLVARKHAGGAGEGGVKLKYSTLHAKSGNEGTFRRFKFEMNTIIKRNQLPDYSLSLVSPNDPDPLMHITARKEVAKSSPKSTSSQTYDQTRDLLDATRDRILTDFPQYELSELQSIFEKQLSERGSWPPNNYSFSFLQFVRDYHARHANN